MARSCRRSQPLAVYFMIGTDMCSYYLLDFKSVTIAIVKVSQSSAMFRLHSSAIES